MTHDDTTPAASEPLDLDRVRQSLTGLEGVLDRYDGADHTLEPDDVDRVLTHAHAMLAELEQARASLTEALADWAGQRDHAYDLVGQRDAARQGAEQAQAAVLTLVGTHHRLRNALIEMSWAGPIQPHDVQRALAGATQSVAAVLGVAPAATPTSPAVVPQASAEWVRVVVVLDKIRGTVHSVTADQDEAIGHTRELVARYGGDPNAATMTAAVVYPVQALPPADDSKPIAVVRLDDPDFEAKLVAGLLDPGNQVKAAPTWGEPYTTGTGQTMRVHAAADCRTATHPDAWCVIHRRKPGPTEHFATHWRSDRGLMEVLCLHGVGHPAIERIAGDGTHGCCGCCAGDGPHCGLCGSQSCPGGTGPASCTPAHLMELYEPASGDMTVMAVDRLGPDDCRRCGGLDGTHTRRDCPHAEEATR